MVVLAPLDEELRRFLEVLLCEDVRGFPPVLWMGTGR